MVDLDVSVHKDKNAQFELFNLTEINKNDKLDPLADSVIDNVKVTDTDADVDIVNDVNSNRMNDVAVDVDVDVDEENTEVNTMPAKCKSTINYFTFV